MDNSILHVYKQVLLHICYMPSSKRKVRQQSCLTDNILCKQSHWPIAHMTRRNIEHSQIKSKRKMWHTRPPYMYKANTRVYRMELHIRRRMISNDEHQTTHPQPSSLPWQPTKLTQPLTAAAVPGDGDSIPTPTPCQKHHAGLSKPLVTMGPFSPLV